jgi:chromosome partitioning protein
MKQSIRTCRICGRTDESIGAGTGVPRHFIEEDLCGVCRTTVVAFASIKGGVGRTNIVILLAKALAAAGKRVLLIDSDLNNSLSYHFLNSEEMEKTRTLNIATALNDERNNLCDYTVKTKTSGVDIIASTPYLADLRTLSEKRLKRIIPTLYGKYDICIVDCPPTYDNIVLNGVNAADFTITPVLKDLFSYNAAAFLSSKLPQDIENFKNWFVLLNGYDKRYEEAKTGRQTDFLNLYQAGEFPLTPVETWMPWTAQIHLIVDYHKDLTSVKGKSGVVYNPELYKAVTELAGCFFLNEQLIFPEVI